MKYCSCSFLSIYSEGNSCAVASVWYPSPFNKHDKKKSTGERWRDKTIAENQVDQKEKIKWIRKILQVILGLSQIWPHSTSVSLVCLCNSAMLEPKKPEAYLFSQQSCETGKH